MEDIKTELAALKVEGETASENKAKALGQEVERLRGRAERHREDKEVYERAAAALHGELRVKLDRSREQRLDRSRTATLEQDKLLFEVFKLVATLGTGVIIAMAAIASGLIPEPTNLSFLWLPFLLILASIVASIGAALLTAVGVSDTLLGERLYRSRWRVLEIIFSVLSIASLLASVFLFSTWVSQNL